MLILPFMLVCLFSMQSSNCRLPWGPRSLLFECKDYEYVVFLLWSFIQRDPTASLWVIVLLFTINRSVGNTVGNMALKSARVGFVGCGKQLTTRKRS